LSKILQDFNSTGIQDKATQCQVTILDAATVIENKLIAASAEIKGDLIVDGNIILNGEIPTNSPFYRDLVEHSAGLLKLSMDGQFFLQYADKVFEKINLDGLEVPTLTVKDEECEISIRKLRKDITVIGSKSEQRVVLSANNKNNIILETDGSVSISSLTVGSVMVTSSPTPPTEPMEKGTIVYNENPEIGKPVGWVSLGDGQWGSFGVIV
jgi:hypothetical protein